MGERNGKFMNVYDLVDAAVADDPSALQRALTMMQPDAAAAFYREECAKNNVGVIQSFCRQIHSNAAFVDFSNNYFGERGIVPVMATLQHLPIVEVRFLKCDLNAEDIARIHTSLMAHPTLTSLDLRGNLLSLPSSRKILSLAIQNRRLTNIVLDDNAPKSILVQRQCLANANVAVHASACVMCQKSMVHSVTGNVESKILVALEERLGDRLVQLCVAEVETLFRCLLACTDVNDGVLFLCSVDCINHLAGDIAEAMRLIHASILPNNAVQREHHRHPVLARCVVELMEHYAQDGDSSLLFVTPVKKTEGDPSEDEWTECTVCGAGCVPLHDSAAFSLVMLCRDVKKGNEVRPTAFLRVIHTMLRYIRLSICSRKCVRHLTRFGLYGFGGVLRSNPDPNDVPLSSIDVSLDYLPDDDFCVVNFAELQVLDHGEEDTTCAVTVASLMTDIDTIPIDPYIIFAVGRYLAKRAPTVFGMELRQACEAVRVVGCLSVDQSPFHRKNRPPRAHYVDWQKWSTVVDVDRIQRLCYARRRQAYFVIDGPADNAFDRIRAALWAFREQHRCVAVVLKFCLAWVKTDQGIVPADMPPRGGFYTAAKVVGQTLLQNSYYLVIQPNFGVNVGNRGFFYIPRSVFNRSVRGASYMFVDTTAIRESQGIQPEQHHQKLVSRSIVRVLEKPSLMFDVVNFVATSTAGGVCLTSQLRTVRDTILAAMPPSMLFLFVAPGIKVPHQFTLLRENLLRLFESSRGTTQLAFMWNEILGEAAAKWVLHSSEKLVTAKRDGGKVDSNESSVSSSAPISVPATAVVAISQEDVDWNVGASALRRSTVPGGSFRVKSPATSSASRFVRTPPVRSVDACGTAKSKTVAEDEAHADPMRAEMEEALKLERIARSEAQAQLHHRSASSWDPNLLGYSPNARAQRYAARDASIPQDLVGARWSSVVLMDDVGQRTSEILLFAKGYVCGYNCSTRSITKSLRRMENDPQFANFPFVNGFDCVVQLRSTKKPEAYFFSEQTWMVWDLTRNYCVTGPHVTRTHRVFRSLPAEFHQRVDGACELPGKNSVLLFSQFRFVVFDLDECRVVQGPLSVASPDGSFFKLASTFPSGPMAVLTLGKSKKQQFMIGYDGVVAKTSVDSLGSLCIDADVASSSSTRGGNSNVAAICDTFLCSLPLALLQQTTLAAPSILATLLDAAPRNKLVNITLFEPVCPSETLKRIVSSEQVLASLGPSWEVLVSSTLHVVEHANESHEQLWPEGTPEEGTIQRDRGNLANLLKPFTTAESTKAPTLLQKSALLRQEERDAEDQNHTVEFDLGTMNASAFAYVQVLLDTATVDARVLQVAPIEIAVEHSHDGVCYTDVGVIVAAASAASAYWGVVHAARYWRLRFINSIPIGVGIVKVLWYKARWVVDASPYELSETFSPSALADVTADAAMLLRKPSELLVDIAPQPVLCVPRDDLWTPRHAILPLLPEGDSCLFFCGNVVLEYDFLDEHVVGNRCVPLMSSPSFAALPFPFNDGLDAIFYPNIHDHSTVVILRDEKLLVWDLFNGTPVGESEDFADSKFFKGLPFPVKRLHDVINIWDYPGHVFVFSDNKVLRWNVLEASVVEGPYTREQIPVFDVPQFAEMPFLAVASFPGDAKTFFIFCGTDVVESVIQRDHKVTMKPPADFRTNDFFNTISRYVEWGVPREQTSVTFDFKDNLPLVTGITMRSSDGCNPGTQWNVEFSDDGAHWNVCAQHVQAVPRSSSNWHLPDVHSVSHRFWKLITVPGTTSTAESSLATVVYNQVLFHVLPSTLLSVSPASLECTGLLQGDPTSLLTGSLGFQLTPPSRFSLETSIEDALLIDFAASPVELVGLSCNLVPCGAALRDTPLPSMVLTVEYSDNGMEWTTVRSWRTTASSSHVRWAPTYPRRFWQVRFLPSSSSRSSVALQIQDIALFENSAPSLVTNESSDVTQLVGILQRNLTSFHVVDFDAAEGSHLAMDFKQSPQALVGVALAIDVDSFTFMTNFEVEYSDDGATWCVVGTLVSCDDLGNAAWGSEGSHRYWRLRVSRHRGAKTVRVKRLELSISGPMLYQHHQRHIDKVSATTYSVFQNRLSAFVSVTATIPSSSVFAVERLDADDFWEPVAVLVNADDAQTRECTCGWPPCSPSASWRLRPLLAASLEEVSKSIPIAEAVSWSSLSCQMTNVAVLPPSSKITTCGFEDDPESQELRSLHTTAQDIQANRVVSSSAFEETVVDTGKAGELAGTQKQRQLGGFGLTATTGSRDTGDAHATWVFTRPPSFSAVTIGLFVDDAVTDPFGVVTPVIGQKNANAAVASSSEQQLLSLGSAHDISAPPPTAVAELLIEISSDGVIFVPVASSSLFSSERYQVNLAWPAIPSPQWRIRFAGLSSGAGSVRFNTVQWGFETAVLSFPRFESSVNLSAPLQMRYIASDTTQQADMRTRGSEGIQQVNSVTTGLRSPDDIDQWGKMTQPLVAMQKAFQKQMVRHIKEHRGDQTTQSGRGAKPAAAANGAAAGGGAIELSSLFQRIANTLHDMRFVELVSLLRSGDVGAEGQAPVSVQELKLMKDSMSWCGPKTEYRGKLAAPLFGFSEITVGVSVRWSLTSEVLRNTMKHLMSSDPLDRALTAPMIALEINRSDWFAGTAFPGLGALLYEYKISERHVTLVVASREIQFTPPQINFVPPGAQALQSKFPFSIYAGINFIVGSTKPKDFLSPAVIHINAMLPKVVLEKPVLFVLNVPSLSASTSIARFSVNVPADFCFNIHGLILGDMVLEIATDLSKSSTLERRRISFLAEQAAMVWGSDPGESRGHSPGEIGETSPHASDGGGNAADGDASSAYSQFRQTVPLHVAGTLGTSAVHIQARSYSGASIQAPCGLKRSTLANIRFAVDVLLTGAAPAEYFPCPVVVHGTLCTDCGLTFPVQMSLSDVNLGRGNLKIDLCECKFSTLVQLAAFLINANGAQLAVSPWMEEVPLRVTATMTVFPAQQAAKASGMVTFYGQSGRISISVTTTGVHMSFTLPSLQLGNLNVMGSEATNGYVLIEAAAPVGGTPSIRLDGLCRTLARRAAPAQIELSGAGTLVISSGTFYDVCVRDDSLYPIGAYATVSVSRDTFIKPLSAALRATSLIATLLSHGLPFSFGLHAVMVTNCALERQAMQLTFRGVLFGFRFDVSTQVTSPENSDRTIATMCDRLASHIMEQCNETLWSSLDTFVGSIQGVDRGNAADDEAPESEEVSGFEKSNNSAVMLASVSNNTGGGASQLEEPGKRAGRRDRVGFSLGIIGSPPSSPSGGGGGEKSSASQRRNAVAREGTFLAHWNEADALYIDSLIINAVKDL